LLSSSIFLDPPATPALLSKSTSSPEGYMEGIQDCCWTMSGMNLLMLSRGTRSLYSLPFARSAATSCYNPVSFHSRNCSFARIQYHDHCYKPRTALFCTEAWIRVR
jgi:hypothetical protein